GGPLDLSRWTTAFVGAEPVRPAPLAEFATRAATFGFATDAFRPCYGLAEATLLVTCTGRGGVQTVESVSGETGVDCGAPVEGPAVEVVDPKTGERLGPGHVGEVWVAGPTVAQGYRRPGAERTASFGAELPHDKRPYLRTGDLGFLTVDGGLVPLGR